MALFAPVGSFRVLGSSGVQASLTGTTTETALATVSMPGLAMGPNGILRVTAQFSCTNNANVKTARLRLGGIGGTAMYAIAVTSTAGGTFQRTIQNRNSNSSQIISFGSASANSYTTVTTAALTSTVDTSATVSVVLSGELAVGTDTISIEQFLMEVAYIG